MLRTGRQHRALLKRHGGPPQTKTLERKPSAMRFRANYVSASEAGDYFQVLFKTSVPTETSADATDDESPYLLIQRQYEDPDDDQCYVETRDEGYIGHFRLRSIEFSQYRVLIALARDRDSRIEVEFEIAEREFQEVARVIDIIAGRSDPYDDHAL